MDISARKFTATQCLYTIVLNNPQLRLTDINGEVNEKAAKAAVKAAFRLAEMMDEEADEQNKIMQIAMEAPQKGTVTAQFS